MPQATVMAEPGPRSPRFPSSKFRAPKGGPGLVRRPRLLERLDRGDQARLTLVVGPAGAGKTMLLADWLASRPERPSAWLSCDAADADPARFVAAIIEAARYGFGQPSIGEDARQLIGLDGEVSADAIAALADDLDAPDEVRVLVIDDFHLAGAASADTLRWLVEYHPPSLQLVVASRVDPPLRVHRMRAHQDLVELRDGDLAFSVEETRSLLAGFACGWTSQSWRWFTGAARDGRPGCRWPRSRSTVRPILPPRLAGCSCTAIPSPTTSWRRSCPISRPEVAEFMLATSVLDELSVPACTALCGQGQRRCSSCFTARTCSWRSWMTRPAPTAITT